jgi:hypothetical protein
MSTKASADTSATPAKVIEKPPAIEYKLAEDGKVTRTDKDSTIHVATLLEGDKLVLVPEWAKFRAPVVRFLNEDMGRNPKSIVLEGDEDKPVKKDIPPRPKKEMRFGDKTPAVVEWYRKYHPAEYKARYGIKGEGTVTKTRKVLNATTGIPESQQFEVDAIIADRKIHGTEKVEAANTSVGGEESEYSK